MTVVPVLNCRSNKAGAFLTSLGVLSVFLVLCVFGGMAEAQDKTFKRTIESYTVPDVTLVNQNGAKVRIKSLLQSDKPVVVDFIFGTCTTICPVLSAGLASLQQQLGADARKVQLVSISIDPENDTPKVMKDYLKRYGAKPGWDFLTGTRTDIDKVLYALSAYIPNKMDHYPLTLIRSPGDGKWVRVRGLMSGAQLMSEVRQAGLK
jgi:protein SCO1/2